MQTNRKKMTFLAPMEGITDFAMRETLTEIAFYDYCVTDFLRVTEQPLSANIIRRHIPEVEQGGCTRAGTPVMLQLLGGSIENLRQTAIQAATFSELKGIDMNFGCPAPIVNRNDGGAALLKDPPRLYEISARLREAVPAEKHVSIKLRIGWSDPEQIAELLAPLDRIGLSWMTIHFRTRLQGYKSPAYYEVLDRAAPSLRTPIIFSGDVWNGKRAEQLRQNKNCAGVMLARGALANPRLAAGEESSRASFREYLFLLEQKFSQLLQKNPGLRPPEIENIILKRMKQWLRYRAMNTADRVFENTKRAQNLAEFNRAWAGE